jgi:pantoate--beta-alanine ligase
MKTFTTIAELQADLALARGAGQSVGLVPTMGALHEGHASLLRAACAENDYMVVSNFVNPTQFAPGEDLANYPRQPEDDCRLAEIIGASAVFAPEEEEMYPQGACTWVEVSGPLTAILCGRSRPAHFRGVATVVIKLFNIVGPCRAYFGQKDGQQAQIIRRLVRDLFLPVDIRIMPLARAADGLALSSRNTYLSLEDRRAARSLYQALTAAKDLMAKGERDPQAVRACLVKRIEAEPLAVLDYAEIYTFPDLTETGPTLRGQVFLGLAVKFGSIRLIDNLVVDCGA